MNEDPRKTGLKNGLRQLTLKQLKRVIDYKEEMVLDNCNYENGKFCALAVGVGLDQTMKEPTHDKVFQTLTDMGYSVYNTRGIVGDFYTTNRKADLLAAANEVFEEKVAEAYANGKCFCLAMEYHCSVCKNGYHIFCNKVMHGDPEEAYLWFINNPETTKAITVRGSCPEYDRALKEINKKENADR